MIKRFTFVAHSLSLGVCVEGLFSGYCPKTGGPHGPQKMV